MLKIQNIELTKLINTLEADRTKLIKQLRHNAAHMGGTGIIFLGLCAYQIIKVNESVSGLSYGSI